ncbi:phosphatase PAP2 family protein [Geomonas subterranea]|uniref:phosphatase PAP2 family protein n=1 Tax=Geomonas subterranea TaxID=2847989 RepID=UPI001C46B06F|nr:phosphatase PAP2 family protein [Geomonas subterranea]QXM07626.1 phosphatase PAP2 family protein [Geomonas subterranea]
MVHCTLPHSVIALLLFLGSAAPAAAAAGHSAAPAFQHCQDYAPPSAPAVDGSSSPGAPDSQPVSYGSSGHSRPGATESAFAPLPSREGVGGRGKLPSPAELAVVDSPSLAAEDFLIRPDGAAGSGAGGPAAATGDPRITAEFPGPAWRWRRSGVPGYLGVAVLGAGAMYVESAHGDPEPKWKGTNGFDETVRDALRLHSRGAREVAHDVGDALMYGMIAAPVLDSLATLGIRDRAWDTLWQTEMVNLESFAFTSFVSSLVQNLVAREKPLVRNCRGGACEGDAPNRSMPSGHVAFAFTGAGLVCSHHNFQSLYRDPGLDRAACWTGLGLAAADGVARIMADHHYATDVAAGAAIGLFSGFLLPRLLHYDRPEKPTEGKKGSGSIIKGLSFRPLIFGGSAGLACEMRY